MLKTRQVWDGARRRSSKRCHLEAKADWIECKQYDNAKMTSQQQKPMPTAAQVNHEPKILLVKLSSLGDVLHNLPIVWDLRKRLPDAQIDWIVEEGYVH